MKRNRAEEEFQAQVVQLAAMFGWERKYHTRDSRGSDRGFPDLVLGRVVRDGDEEPVGALGIAAELKVGANTTTPEQDAWLEFLALMGFVTRVWYPTDWADITAVLGGRTWPRQHPRPPRSRSR